MAKLALTRVRAISVLAALGAGAAVAVVVPTVALASPSHPATTGSTSADLGNSASTTAKHIAAVRTELASLSRASDQIVERYDQANIRYHAAKAAAAKAEATYHVDRRQLTTASDQFASSAAAQYEGGTFSAAGALLDSDSGSSYLDQLDTLSMLSSHNAQTMNNFALTQKRAQVAKEHADTLFQAAVASRSALAGKKTQVTAQIGEYRAALASLTAKQREIVMEQQVQAEQVRGRAVATQAALAKVTPALRKVHVSSAAAAKAIAFAKRQIGKPYVWGSGGPSSFDCSGLTMASYAAAGVSLPHSAAGQYNYGHHVSMSQLQPGDLLFYYQPIGHVTIYVGDGMMVSAPTAGESVQLLPITETYGGNFTGATRLVG